MLLMWDRLPQSSGHSSEVQVEKGMKKKGALSSQHGRLCWREFSSVPAGLYSVQLICCGSGPWLILGQFLAAEQSRCLDKSQWAFRFCFRKDIVTNTVDWTLKISCLAHIVISQLSSPRSLPVAETMVSGSGCISQDGCALFFAHCMPWYNGHGWLGVKKNLLSNYHILRTPFHWLYVLRAMVLDAGCMSRDDCVFFGGVFFSTLHALIW